MPERKYNWNVTKEILEATVKKSTSVREVLCTLNLPSSSNGYVRIRLLFNVYAISVDHFTRYNSYENLRLKKPLEYYFNATQAIHTHSLKLRLIREGILQYQCSCCKITEWQGKPVPLELHHIDGSRKNNKLSNLELLCPNCHAQTTTNGGKNSRVEIKKKNYCNCGKEILLCSISCKKCIGEYAIRTHYKDRIVWPSKEELEKLIWEGSTSQLAKKLGVSDTSIAKRCRRYGIIKPARGYWEKVYHTKIEG